MGTLTIDAIRRDPAILQALHAEARRARAGYVHQLLKGLIGARDAAPDHAHRDRQLEELRTACCA